MKYDYYLAVRESLLDYIATNTSPDEFDDLDALVENINAAAFLADEVTGNASGSFFCSAWEAEEALAHNWDLLREALECFGDDLGEALRRGAEWCDVCVRCYLVSGIVRLALEEYAETLEG